MSKISNWTELLNEVSNGKGIFKKLLTKINQTIRLYQKSNSKFDPNIVQKNHQEFFTIYKLTYEQLLVEKDIIDIFLEIPSLHSDNTNITFNMVGIGKWIKLYFGNSSRIFFFDDEKTAISDKSLADFLNRLEIILPQYEYFGKKPSVYYKFTVLPNDDIIKYLKNHNVIPLELSQETPIVNYPRDPSNKVLLDQNIVLTYCSNLSYGLSTSFYDTQNDKNLELVVNNKIQLDEIFLDKEIIMSQDVFDQTKYKFDHMAGSLEKQRFNELSKKIKIVPDIKNLRFYYLKDIELICASIAEYYNAIIVTSNQRLCNKINTYYPEIFFKLFIGIQLAENKYN